MEDNKTTSRRSGSLHQTVHGGTLLKYITISALFTLAIGVSFIYAEQQVLVELPIDSPFETTGIQCRNTVNPVGVWCGQTWAWYSGNVTLPLMEIEETVEEEIIEEEIIVEPEEELTREERDIQRMIDRIELDLQERPDAVPIADQQLLILLKRAQDECYFGIEQGAPIQQYALFAIPKGSLYIDDVDLAKYNMLGKIAKLIEACTAWDKYRFTHLGQQYADINQAGIDATPFVPSAVLSENVTNTKEYIERFIGAHDIIEEEEDAAKFMCSVLGKQRGLCPEAIGEDVYIPDTTDNPVLSKYLQYRAEPESALGEPKYDVTTNAKCAILSGYVKQFELSDESRDIIMQEAGCKV